MTQWRPAAGPEAAAARAAMLQRIRHAFAESHILEVDTPALSPFAISDTQIESFEIHQSAVSARPLFLHTSPEFCMKRLLAAGYPDIYSICRVFRDGESGQRHQPEFTMIEWYRLGFGLQDIIGDSLRIIRAALAAAAPSSVRQFDYRQLFIDSIGLEHDSVFMGGKIGGAFATGGGSGGGKEHVIVSLLLAMINTGMMVAGPAYGDGANGYALPGAAATEPGTPDEFTETEVEDARRLGRRIGEIALTLTD